MSLLSRLRRLLSPAQRRLVEAAADVSVPGSAELSDIRHVVILMQENRSFDHYFGTMSAVRGFSDPRVLTRDVGGVQHPVFDQFGAGEGGDKFVQINTEYHFLLGGPFRLLLFTDAGNVYGKVNNVEQSFNFSQLRWTAGVELRVTLPVLGAPLRFIYSKNLRPDSQDEFETFQFSIGTSF